MITLNNGDSLIAKLEGVVTANQPTYYVSFLDTLDVPGNSKGVLNSTSEVTIVSTPATDVKRLVSLGTIFNKDTTNVTVLLQVANGLDRTTLLRKTLLPNTKLEFGKDGYKSEGVDLAEALQGLTTPANLVNLCFTGASIYATVGEDVAIGDILYLKSDGKFWKADADVAGTTNGLVVLATTTILTNASGVLLTNGYIKNTSWSFTPGVPLYISATPGNATTTAPTSARLVGYAYSSNIINFHPEPLSSGLSEDDVISLILSYT